MFNLFNRRKENTVKVDISVYIEEDEGVFYAYSPTLPGLRVEGGTEKEVKQNVHDAVSAYIISLIKHNDPLPIGAIIQMPPTTNKNVSTYSFTEDIPLAFAQ